MDDANRTAPRRPDTRILRSAVSDFLAACWDLVANEIAKSRYMTGAQMSFPLVIRTANGGGSQAALHRRGEPQALWQGAEIASIAAEDATIPSVPRIGDTIRNTANQ